MNPPSWLFAPREDSRTVSLLRVASPPRTSCADVCAHLHEFVNGELDVFLPDEFELRIVVTSHVARCAKCARVESQLVAMRQALAAVGARSACDVHTQRTRTLRMTASAAAASSAETLRD